MARDKAYFVNKFLEDYNADNRNNRTKKEKKPDRTIKILAFSAINLMLITGLAIGWTIYNINKDNQPLLASRTFKDLETELSAINENEEGVGGACLPDNIVTPYTSLDYYIKRGDSIHSIAKRFGIDECTIIKLNHIDIPSKIVRGQKIQIPNQNGISVNVTRRQTLDQIAKKYNIEKDELLRINNISDEKKVAEVFIPGVEYDSVSKKLLLGEYFRRPTNGRFTSMFGHRPDPFTNQKSYHTGVDIANRQNTKVYAAAPGKVVFVGNVVGYGNLVKIQHTAGYVSYYGHLNKFGTKVGAWVSAGTLVGYMGSTGYSTGNHLHYEIRHYNKPINPMTVTVF